jgi:hypothetical protein
VASFCHKIEVCVFCHRLLQLTAVFGEGLELAAGTYLAASYSKCSNFLAEPLLERSETQAGRYLERPRASGTKNLSHSAGCLSEPGIEQVSTSA